MQPQDPNQNTNPAGAPPTPPAPAPEPPTPTPPVAPVTPTPAPVPDPAPTPITPTPTPAPTFDTAGPTPLTPQEPKKGLPTKKIIIGIVGLLLLAGLTAGIYSLFANTGPKLSDYSGQKFSIRYPEGFEKRDEAINNVMFVEKGDIATASKVGAGYEEYEEPIGQDQVDADMAALKEGFQNGLADFYGEEGVTFTDVKVEDTTFQGQNAIQTTAKVVKKGKETGTIKYVASVNITSSYILFVEADNSDPAVKDATDEILNSFAIKL